MLVHNLTVFQTVNYFHLSIAFDRYLFIRKLIESKLIWQVLASCFSSIYSYVLVIQNEKVFSKLNLRPVPLELPYEFGSVRLSVSNASSENWIFIFFCFFCMTLDTPKVRRLAKLEFSKKHVGGSGGPKKT